MWHESEAARVGLRSCTEGLQQLAVGKLQASEGQGECRVQRAALGGMDRRACKIADQRESPLEGRGREIGKTRSR